LLKEKSKITRKSQIAFVLLGKAKGYARRLGLDGSEIQAEMMKGDYEHLLEVFDKYFGAFVILER